MVKSEKQLAKLLLENQEYLDANRGYYGTVVSNEVSIDDLKNGVITFIELGLDKGYNHSQVIPFLIKSATKQLFQKIVTNNISIFSKKNFLWQWCPFDGFIADLYVDGHIDKFSYPTNNKENNILEFIETIKKRDPKKLGHALKFVMYENYIVKSNELIELVYKYGYDD